MPRWTVLTDIILLTSILYRGEWTSSSNESFAIGPFVKIVRLGFVEACWVAQGEYDGTLDMFCHFSNGLLGKRLGLGGCSDQDVRLDLLDHGKQVVLIVCWPLVVVSCEGFLGRS